MKIKNNRRAFTIVELVIVIAVIAILAAVLIPTFSGIVDKANRSSAMQEARNAWNEVSYTYASGYDGLAYAGDELNGWYYDYEDGIAKYTVDEKYTVTYDGENWIVNDIDGSAWVWDEITEASTEMSASSLTDDPFALVVTYYDSIYTRGFSWMTSTGGGEAYIAEGVLDEADDWSGATELTVVSANHTSYYGHKAHTDTLAAGTVYSYKVGTEGHWEYGTFRAEQSSISSITAIQLSDAQTKNPNLLNVWENTMAQAIETAGHGLDMILYNGDQFDSNMTGESVNRQLRYGIARDTISEYLDSIPYMSSSGNHESATSEANNVQEYNNEIVYDGTATSGAYYSYDYGFAHFVVLNTNLSGSDLADENTWLKSDLAAAQSSKWIIVTMHIGCYATGDHSNGVSNIITTFAPTFAEYHVDLVLQAHDHTYSKTLPYNWGKSTSDVQYGWTKTYNNSTVVNFNVQKTTSNGRTYDLNPNGTYYVTTGAAGHRAGESEGDAGIWADVTGTGTSSQLSPLYSGSTFLNNTYKIEVGKITYSNTYSSFDCSSPSYSNDQVYNAGDPATGNVNAQMFGILNLTETTLTYDFYTVDGNEVKLFDSLNIMKK